MIKTYVEELAKIMDEDGNVLVLWSDAGVGGSLSSLKVGFPERCLCVPRGRQAMFEQAIEAADNGMQCWVNLPPSFSSSSGLSRIRGDIFASHRNIKIIGISEDREDMGQPVRTGMADIGIMRSMPGSMVMVPSDPGCTRTIIRHAHSVPSGVYVRMEDRPTPTVYPEGTTAFPLRVSILRKGSDAMLLATGSAVAPCVECSDILGAEGIAISVGDIHTLKPLDEGHIRRLALTHSRIWAIEDGAAYGGVYSAVNEALSDIGMGGKLKCADMGNLPNPPSVPSETMSQGRVLAAFIGGQLGQGAYGREFGNPEETRSAIDFRALLNSQSRLR